MPQVSMTQQQATQVPLGSLRPDAEFIMQTGGGSVYGVKVNVALGGGYNEDYCLLFYSSGVQTVKVEKDRAVQPIESTKLKMEYQLK